MTERLLQRYQEPVVQPRRCGRRGSSVDWQKRTPRSSYNNWIFISEESRVPADNRSAESSLILAQTLCHAHEISMLMSLGFLLLLFFKGTCASAMYYRCGFKKLQLLISRQPAIPQTPHPPHHQQHRTRTHLHFPSMHPPELPHIAAPHPTPHY